MLLYQIASWKTPANWARNLHRLIHTWGLSLMVTPTTVMCPVKFRSAVTTTPWPILHLSTLLCRWLHSVLQGGPVNPDCVSCQHLTASCRIVLSLNSSCFYMPQLVQAPGAEWLDLLRWTFNNVDTYFHRISGRRWIPKPAALIAVQACHDMTDALLELLTVRQKRQNLVASFNLFFLDGTRQLRKATL